MALTGIPKQKVLATVVKLLEITKIRVENEEYAQTNKSFGLTTMREPPMSFGHAARSRSVPAGLTEELR